MRKILSLLVLVSCISLQMKAQYSDHRFHNVDSLETVMSRWTASGLEEAGKQDLKSVADALDDLMYGFVQTNSVKCEYYARMLLGISERNGWLGHKQSAAKVIGQIFWGKERYDSAAFYYGAAMDAIARMPVAETGADNIETYTQKKKDDALSLMYGTLGNLYSIQDSTDIAMDYYGKAEAIFEKYGWDSSRSILYCNMGETMREKGRFKEAEGYYSEGLKFSKATGDSLLVAGAYKGLGELYLDTGKTSKALRFLDEANKYFADHEDEELLARLDSLKHIEQVLELQKKRLSAIVILLVAIIMLSIATYYISTNLKRTAREKKELTQVLEDTVDAIGNVPEHKDIQLKPREKEILDLIAKGFTNAEVAAATCLSQETIKWYKKKFFAMFDASNSADLVRIVKDKGLI